MRKLFSAKTNRLLDFVIWSEVSFLILSTQISKNKKKNFKIFSGISKKFSRKKGEKRGNFKKDCKKTHKKSVSKGLIDMYLNHIVDTDDSFSKKMKKY